VAVPVDTPLLVDGLPATPRAAHVAVDRAFTRIADQLVEQARRVTGTLAEMLAATAQIAADPALRAQVLARVDAGEPPVAAIDAAVSTFAARFEQAGGQVAERVTDLRSVRDRVVAAMLGMPAPGVPDLTEACVVVARDLAPADTAALDLSQVLAIVTELGGPTAHTAIIARQLGIPCLVQVTGATTLPDGAVVAVDALVGAVTVDPDDALRAELEARAEALRSLAVDAEPGTTADGQAVVLLANIGTLVDAERVAASAAEGVGLFRTEMLFNDRAVPPSHAEQTETYAWVLRAMGGRRVVVRTLDAGADTPLAFVTGEHEENPALGVRGYRLVRTHPELLATQLEAVADAQRATGTTPWVMAPMIATPQEARGFAEAARAVGIEKVGVMVEVPAAALRAEQILAEVDFVSLGTNDLSQYAMATDRMRGELADLLSPWQPAVLDMVAAAAQAGLRTGKPVGVCGESAADPLMALVLVGLGVTSLSTAPTALPAVRFAIRRHTKARCVEIADAVLAAGSHEEARARAVALADPEVCAKLNL